MCAGRVKNLVHLFVIDRIALKKQGDNALGSIRPFVCVFVCLCALSCLTYDLDFWYLAIGRPWK